MKIPMAKKIPAMAGVLRRSLEECMLEGLALVDVPDTVNDLYVGTAKAVVEGEDMEPGTDAVANCLTITVATELKPGGVMVFWSARTPAMPDEALKKG